MYSYMYNHMHNHNIIHIPLVNCEAHHDHAHTDVVGDPHPFAHAYIDEDHIEGAQRGKQKGIDHEEGKGGHVGGQASPSFADQIRHGRQRDVVRRCSFTHPPSRERRHHRCLRNHNFE